MLANASGLTWIDSSHVLFSEIDSGIHMGIVTSGESRSDERAIYWPAHIRGMAHRSYRSPNGKSVLLVEMDSGGWEQCRLVPFDGTGAGQKVGPPVSPGILCSRDGREDRIFCRTPSIRRLVAGRRMDVLQFERNRCFSHLASAG
jgi:hypothetical protein